MSELRILVVYYSQTGNTKKMAELIEKGVKGEGVDVQAKNAEEAKVKDLLEADCIIMGSPVYYGTMAWQLKKLLDDSVSKHGSLDGKIGGAFSSSANIGGGNETTITDILNAMLIHGMIIQGDPKGDHYGPVSIGKPDQRVEKQCLRFGQRLANLTQKINK